MNTELVESKIKYWINQLHDMSRRNRLLFHKDTKTSTATIVNPPLLELFEKLVVNGEALTAPLPEVADFKSIFGDEPGSQESPAPKPVPKSSLKIGENELQTGHSTETLNKVLYNLRYSSRTVQEEQGFNILFVTFGMLKWREAQNSEFIYAPLVLVPVIIERESPNSAYTIAMAEDDIVLNPVLQAKVLKDFGVQLPELSNEITSGELDQYWDVVSASIAGFDGWEVLKKATIGTFNFLTLLIIKDFENHLQTYINHPLIQLISGAKDINIVIPEDLPLAEELDELVEPSTVFQIMDADSSQQEAIEAAKRGLSFILQGPPGTGKSQTISNIISECLMAGKKVLFVSQKMAALEVVQSRLRERGLDEFCLEIHSHKMDKRRVIVDLMRAFNNAQVSVPRVEFQRQQIEIKQLKDELNQYIRELHKPRFNLEISLQKAMGYLAEYLDAPQIGFTLPDVTKVTPQSFNQMIALVRELSKYEDIINIYHDSRWKGFGAKRISILERENIEIKFNSAADAIEELDSRTRKIASEYGLPEPETVQDSVDCFHIASTFKPEIFSESLSDSITHYLNYHKSFSRYVRPKYWMSSFRLRRTFRRDLSRKPVQVSTLLEKIVALKRKIPTWAETQTRPELSLDEDALLISDYQKISNAFALATELFEANSIPLVLQKKYSQRSSSLTAWFRDLGENSHELSDWANFNSIIGECKEIGLGDFAQKALEARILADNWQNSFQRRFYVLLTELIADEHPTLQKFRGTLQSEKIQRFKELDKQLIQSAPNEIKAKLHAARPQSSWVRAESAETSVLRREFNKKRRIKPLRKLFQEIPNLIQTLKPCLMMSPLTVCQLLDPQIFHFDLAIFDEASQIPPEYAASAFSRATQVIVAGDRQQLPPTNFFHVAEFDTDDVDESDDQVPFESILNACDSYGFQRRTLNWHYRSKDESLIAYSNYHFYENRLFTFPSSSSKNEVTGLSFVFVDKGVYKKGAGARHNLIEAMKVADLVREHLEARPQLSLGIVAFSVSQRMAIEAAINKMRSESPEINELFLQDSVEPMFIKNLENVQGDERDVIILSVGYGKDETGKMTLNFGPLNREGGERRLNVAVTRARVALKVVSSIEPEDIDITRINSQGALLLRSYLETARDGMKAIYKDEKNYVDAEFDSPFEDSVYNDLTRRGLEIVPQLGVSQYRIDLAVKDPEQPGHFILGIECDGAMYHSALTARDRDRLRQQILESLGWKIHRIWSRDWIENREGEVEKVFAAIKGSAAPEFTANPVNSNDSGVINTKIDENFESTDLNIGSRLPPGAVPYKSGKLLKQHPSGGQALLEAPLSHVISAFKAIVDFEGPISKNAAKYRVIEAWDSRKGRRIDIFLESAISLAGRKNYIVIKNDFLWPVGMNNPPLRVHVAGQSVRPIDEIAPEEIAKAIHVCVESALGISVDDLGRETCRIFGINSTEDSMRKVQMIMRILINANVLKLDENKIVKGEKFS